MAKQNETPVADKVETPVANKVETPAPKAITKTVSVYAVKVGDKSVNYPTKARANDAKETLQIFGIEATIEVIKKTVEI